jgi:hypothetical protein
LDALLSFGRVSDILTGFSLVSPSECRIPFYVLAKLNGAVVSITVLFLGKSTVRMSFWRAVVMTDIYCLFLSSLHGIALEPPKDLQGRYEYIDGGDTEESSACWFLAWLSLKH